MTDDTDTAVRAPSRGEARRIAFLQAATEVFLEQGYEAASVNEVVRRAGGSLATLYAQFGNKDGLFIAVIEASTEVFAQQLLKSADHDRPLAEGLQEIGETFLTGVLSPGSLAFFRIMVGEGRKFPDMMARFLEVGPERVRAAVAEFLLARGPKEALHLTPEEADFAGISFCDMVRAHHQYRALSLGDTYSLAPQELRAHVCRCVHLLLHGVCGIKAAAKA